MTIAYFLNRFKLIIGISFTCLFFGQSLFAQDFGLGLPRPKGTPGPPGTLIVISIQTAAITLDPLFPGADIQKITDYNGTAIFESLKSGNYKVTASLDGYESEVIEILVPSKETTIISLKLTRLTNLIMRIRS